MQHMKEEIRSLPIAQAIAAPTIPPPETTISAYSMVLEVDAVAPCTSLLVPNVRHSRLMRFSKIFAMTLKAILFGNSLP